MIYKFNKFELNTDNYCLLFDSKEIPVEPLVFNLIVFLIENKDKIVSRDEILDNVWQGRVVSDTSINNHIKSARKVLGDDGLKQQVIKTIHSRGYQFIAKADKSTFKPRKFNSKISIILIVLLLLFFSIKHYQNNELIKTVRAIADYQKVSYATFIAQAGRRNELVAMIEERLGKKRKMQFEKYFAFYFEELNEQEKFVFDQIRAMTDTGLYQNNVKIIEQLNSHPKIYSQIKGTRELQQHLTFWLNKYSSVFTQRQDMCLLYVGVEDGVPYPNEVNQNIKDWLGDQTTDSIDEPIPVSHKSTQQLIAVLPFTNTKPDSDSDYLSFALANQIIGNLDYLDKFTIRPAGSVRKYTNQMFDPIQVGQELKVDYVLNGNYLKENNVIRLNVELIDITSNEILWRKSIEVDYLDTFTLQDLVASQVAKGLNASFTTKNINRKNRDIPNSALAYEYYLRGISYPFSNEGHKLAVEMLEKSIQLDPNYAPSYAHLGNHKRLMEQHGRVVPAGSLDTEWYYKKALGINPELPEALNNLSAFYTETNRLEDALVITRKTLKINPNSADSHFALGYIYRYAGMLDEAIEEMEIALTISPGNTRFRSIISTYLSAGKYKQALQKVYLDKGDYGLGYSGIIAFEQEKYDLARSHFNKVLEIDVNGIWGLISQFYLAFMDNNTSKALDILAKIIDTNIEDAENIYYAADFYALLNKKEQCLDLLEKAINSGYFNYPHISQNSSFIFVQSDPQFIQILKKAKHRHDAFRSKFF
ncbi:MAG: winged helix-turn-helix domain-containing protein [Alcanivoracaceae bacterium]|nr:winged helix-turn-helix domain-containing protein [Alcanivoracaceae bacterium]